MYKKCTTCDELKPRSAFHARKASKDGLAASCKECINEKNRLKYELDPDFRFAKIKQVSKYRAKQNAA